MLRRKSSALPLMPALFTVVTAVAVLLALVSAGCLSHHQGAMPGEPKGATFAHVGEARMRYIDRGGGPTVLLLHGFASAIEAWGPVLPALLPRHRVIAVDLMGFGWTDRPPGDYSPLGQARRVLALLDQRGVQKISVVAHSWGSSVALAMAQIAPDRIRRIAIYDGFVFDDQKPTLFRWAKVGGIGELLFALFYKERPEDKLALAFYDPTRISQRFVDEVEHALDRPGTTAAALAAIRAMDLSALEAGYSKVQQPVLLLWGREDKVTPLAAGERLASLLRRARLVVYPRCGHFPMLEARHASNDELARFLADDLALPPSPPALPSAPAPAPAGGTR
jgi:pimeloyl-ACP methyl ester carboxylesterase